MDSALGLILYAKERLTPTEEDSWDNFEKFLKCLEFSILIGGAARDGINAAGLTSVRLSIIEKFV
jgi:hypothetical protein